MGESAEEGRCLTANRGLIFEKRLRRVQEEE